MDIIRIARKARNQARDMARAATAPLRMLPSMLVIGGQKCGTTSLFTYLVQHPCVLPPTRKEIGFFDRRFHCGVSWYRSKFPMTIFRSEHRTLEASTGYISYPYAPERVRAVLPHVHLLALVRNPIDRAWSHYHHTVRLGHEDRPFEEAIRLEHQRLGTYYERVAEEPAYDRRRNYYSYLSRGHYAEQLEMWLDCFEPGQLLVLSSEDLFVDPKETTARALEHMGLSGAPDIAFARHNSGESDRRSMAPDTREWLRAYFKPHNERLYELLSRDLGWR